MSELIGLREFARRLGVSDTAIRKAINSQRITVAGYTEKSNRPLIEWPKAHDDFIKNTDATKRTHSGGLRAIADFNDESRKNPIVLEKRNDVLGITKKENPAPAKKPKKEKIAKNYNDDIDDSFRQIEEFAQPLLTTENKPEKTQSTHSNISRVVNPDDLPTIAESRQLREAYLAELSKLEFDEKSGKLTEVEKVKRDAFKLARVVRDAMLNIPDRVAHELAHDSDPARVHIRLTEEIRFALMALQEAKI
jgi:hypothetical protein